MARGLNKNSGTSCEEEEEKVPKDDLISKFLNNPKNHKTDIADQIVAYWNKRMAEIRKESPEVFTANKLTKTVTDKSAEKDAKSEGKERPKLEQCYSSEEENDNKEAVTVRPQPILHQLRHPRRLLRSRYRLVRKNEDSDSEEDKKEEELKTEFYTPNLPQQESFCPPIQMQHDFSTPEPTKQDETNLLEELSKLEEEDEKNPKIYESLSAEQKLKNLEKANEERNKTSALAIYRGNQAQNFSKIGEKLQKFDFDDEKTDKLFGYNVPEKFYFKQDKVKEEIENSLATHCNTGTSLTQTDETNSSKLTSSGTSCDLNSDDLSFPKYKSSGTSCDISEITQTIHITDNHNDPVQVSGPRFTSSGTSCDLSPGTSSSFPTSGAAMQEMLRELGGQHRRQTRDCSFVFTKSGFLRVFVYALTLLFMNSPSAALVPSQNLGKIHISSTSLQARALPAI